MVKNFQQWHFQKSFLHEHKMRVFFHRREVWFASLGINIGFEQDGKGDKFLRPIIVLKKFNNEVLWAIPTTTKNKNGPYFRFDQGNNDFVTAIISQLRLMDSKRLEYKFLLK